MLCWPIPLQFNQVQLLQSLQVREDCPPAATDNLSDPLLTGITGLGLTVGEEG